MKQKTVTKLLQKVPVPKNMVDFNRSKLAALMNLDASATGLYREAGEYKTKGSSYWRMAADSLGESQ